MGLIQIGYRSLIAEPLLHTSEYLNSSTVLFFPGFLTKVLISFNVALLPFILLVYKPYIMKSLKQWFGVST